MSTTGHRPHHPYLVNIPLKAVHAWGVGVRVFHLGCTNEVTPPGSP